MTKSDGWLCVVDFAFNSCISTVDSPKASLAMLIGIEGNPIWASSRGLGFISPLKVTIRLLTVV